MHGIPTHMQACMCVCMVYTDNHIYLRVCIVMHASMHACVHEIVANTQIVVYACIYVCMCMHVLSPRCIDSLDSKSLQQVHRMCSVSAYVICNMYN
jgi:hypothetical protein